jgi:hypothetical protein
MASGVIGLAAREIGFNSTTGRPCRVITTPRLSGRGQSDPKLVLGFHDTIFGHLPKIAVY